MLIIMNTYRWSFLSVRYLKLHARTDCATGSTLPLAMSTLWIVLLPLLKFVDLLYLLSVNVSMGLKAADICVLCDVVYLVHTTHVVCNVHTVHSVNIYTVHIIFIAQNVITPCILHTVHTVHTLRTIHIVHNLHNIHTVHTVYSLAYSMVQSPP